MEDGVDLGVSSQYESCLFLTKLTLAASLRLKGLRGYRAHGPWGVEGRVTERHPRRTTTRD